MLAFSSPVRLRRGRGLRRYVVGALVLLAAGAWVAPALATPPTNLNAPTITGTFRLGETLTASSGDWLGSAPLSYAYQWQTCASYQNLVLGDGPAGYWRLADAAGATSAADASATSPANTGTYYGLPTLGVAGPLAGDANSAASFNGSSHYVEVPDAASLKPTNAFTVEAWVKTTSGNGVILSKPYTAGSQVSYQLLVSGSHVRVATNLGGTQYTADWDQIADGNWHHVVGTFDGSSLKLYVDAALKQTTATSGSLQYSTLPLEIARFDASGSYFNGSLDELALYPSALSAAQVSAHYATATSTSGVEPCSDIAGATSVAYTLAASEVGKRVRVKVTAQNGEGSSSVTSYASAVSSGAPLNLTVPSLSGTLRDGNALSAQPGDWSGTIPIAYAYQWQRCGYVNAVLANGPLDYWRLGEAAGTSAADAAGANTGTYSAVTLGQGGALGGEGDSAASFDGSSSSVALPGSYPTGRAPASIEAWVKADANVGSSSVAGWGENSATSRHGFFLALNWDGVAGILSPQIQTNGDKYGGITNLTKGSWYDLVAVDDGTSLKLYVNGLLDSSFTPSGSFSKQNGYAEIGRNVPAVTDHSFYKGLIDEVSFYNAALSPAQVAAHYSAGASASSGAGCTDIANATSASYTLSGSEVSRRVRLKVSASNAPGLSVAYSPVSDLVASAGPVNTGPPLVTGSAGVGQTLSLSSNGTWQGNAPSFADQWQRCTSYGSTLLADNPVGYWRLDEAAGTIAADLSGNGNTGTYVDAPARGLTGALSGDGDPAAGFDGVSQSVSLPGSYPSARSPASIESWIKTASFSSGVVAGWGQNATSGEHGFFLDVTSGGHAEIRTNGATYTGSLTLQTNTWYDLVAVDDGTTLKLYVNGALDHSFTPSGSFSKQNGAAEIGRNVPAGSGFFSGTIDEVSFYGAALSASQVSAHYAAATSAPSCSDIAGASASSYTLTSSELKKQVRLKVTGTNASGSAAGYAALSALVEQGPPVVSTLPALSGQAADGQTLQTTTGSWRGAGPISFAEQWQRCTSSYPLAVLADSPLGYWRLGDGSGSRSALDLGVVGAGSYQSVGLAKTGALAGDGDTAASFDGQTGVVGLPSSTLPTGRSPATIEAWVKSASFLGNSTIAGWGNDATSGQHGFFLGVDGSNPVHLQIQTNGNGYRGNTTPQTNTWYDLALVDDGTNLKLYVNGVLDSSFTAPGLSKLNSVASIGRNAPSVGGFFKGTIDEVAFYPSALSASRLLAHYNAGTAAPTCANVSGATGTSFALSSPDIGKQLRASVTATSSAGSGSAASAPSAPVASAPPGQDAPVAEAGVATKTPVLSAVALAGGPWDYAFQVAWDDQFAQPVESSGWLPSTTTYTVTSAANLQEGESYYWRVRARSGGQMTAWSAARKFTVHVNQFGERAYWPLFSHGPLAVNEGTGNLILSLPAPAFPSAVGQMGLALTYNSLDDTAHDANADRGLGAGWILSAGDAGGMPERLLDHNALSGSAKLDAAEVFYADGSSVYFSHVGGSSVYQAPPGNGSQLTKNPDATWTLDASDGSVFTFGSAGGGGFATLTRRELTSTAPGQGALTYTYNANPLRLTKITDASNRSLTLTWNVISPSGCASAILCVSGPDGVVWKYIGPDATPTSGLLTRVNDGTRDLVKISYASGRPTSVQNANDLDPSHASAGYNGAHTLAIAYDGSNRVSSIADGPVTNQTPASSTWSFAYSPGAVVTSATRAAHGALPAGSTRIAAGATTITPPRQQGQQNPKTTTVYYDSLGHPMEQDDVLGRVSERSYNSHDQLVWAEDALGNSTDQSWDTTNDVLLSSTGPDPDGAGPLGRPVTSYRYDETQIGTACIPNDGACGQSYPLQGLQAQYYANVNLSGRPTLGTDQTVDFNWGSGGPALLGTVADNFSARWSADLTVPYDGDYSFVALSDDGARLVLDGTFLVDAWHDQTLTRSASQPIHLAAGSVHKLVFEYYEKTGPAEVHLRWSCANCTSPSGPAPISEQVIPAAQLLPAWHNQTSTVSPSGRIAFSHFASPDTGKPDYSLVKLADGTKLITSYSYDSFGRIVQKATPRGNAARTIDAQGNLQGALDTSYATTWTYFASAATAAPPQFCGGGSAIDQGQLLKSVVPHGMAATSYVSDVAGRALAKTDGAGTTCTAYSAEGRVTAQTDGNGHTTNYAYDPAGSVLSVTAADSSVSRTAYDESGAVVSKTDANNHTTSFAHDAEGNVIQTTNPLSNTTTFAYDAAGNRTSATDPLNHTTSYAYDALNRPTSTTSPLGKVSTVAYDALGHVAASTDPRGNTTSYAYDADGEQVSVTDALGHISSASYDAAGRLISKTDANNHTTSFGYDLDGNQTTVIAPDGGVTTLAYDSAGNLTSKTDPLNHTTGYGYDSARRPISTTLPTGQVTRLAYDAASNRISSTDPAGKTTTFVYDALNRPIRETSPLGEVTQTAYDAAGNRTSVTDPLNHSTSYGYDAANRLVTMTDPLTHQTTLAYDAVDRLISRTDANSHATGYGYDADGNRTSVTAPGGGSTTLAYDSDGNLTGRTDPSGHATTYVYDVLNQLVSKTDPLNRTWTYSYDAVGNRTKVVDGNGNQTPDPSDGTTTYGYDAANRPLSIGYSDLTPAVSFSYDLAGQRLTMADGAGTESYSYDNAGRLTGVTRSGQSFAYVYDSAGRLASRTYPDGTQTTYGYDNDSRLASVARGTNTTSYGYDAASQLTFAVLPNGWTEQRTYDAAGRLSDIRSVNGQQTLAVATYTRDPVGNPTQIVRDGVTETYAYDINDRITNACYGGQIATCPNASLVSYSYDTVGNRLSQTKFGTATTYSYDVADELAQTVSGAQTTNYAYDGNGNQIATGTKSFSYDLANRLTQVRDGVNTLASFSYDGLGNRLTKVASSQTLSYAWDENGALPQLALESGTGVARSYVYGLGLVSMASGGSSYYFHHDAVGSTAALTSQTGATEWTYTYDPYGAARTQTKVDPLAPDNVMQFTGQLLDSETGLYDLRARLYDPASGRLLSTDPLPQDPSDPALSVYVYGNDGPLVLTDPSGQRPLDEGSGDGVGDPGSAPPPGPHVFPPPPSGPFVPPFSFGSSDGRRFIPPFHLGSPVGGPFIPLLDLGSSASPGQQAFCLTASVDALVDCRARGGDSTGAATQKWCYSATREQCQHAQEVLYGSECASPKLEDREKCAYDFFSALGLSPVQVAAILASLDVESGFNPTLRQDCPASQCFQGQTQNCNQLDYFTPGCGVGIAQWTYYSRQDNLETFAGCGTTAPLSSISSCPRAFDFRVQLEYLWRELTTDYAPTLAKLRRETDISHATRTFNDGYEGGSLERRRESSACNFYQEFQRYRDSLPVPSGCSM